MGTISQKDCESWKLNPNVNPITKRKISPDGPVFKRFSQICENGKGQFTDKDCNAWKKNPTRNPVTGRKLRTDTKTGIYQQLVKLCGSKTTSATKDIEAMRTKLAQAIHKAIGPLLKKGDTTEARLRFAKVMQRYTANLQPCIQEQNNKLWLLNKKKETLVYFDKQIGSKSVYGMAYMNMGKGLAKLLKFSCKLMSAGKKAHKQEVEILKLMSSVAERGESPNMPITYLAMKCTKACVHPGCPPVTQTGGYYVVINELASCDIQTWFQKKHDRSAYESIIMQLFLSIYTFHKLGFGHNDCHLGNFLIHEITPGGCWRYQVDGQNIYVPNKGYLLVMWDPGLATKLLDFRVDYRRPLHLMSKIASIQKYIDMKMIPPPDDVIHGVLLPMITQIVFSTASEKQTISKVIGQIKNGSLKFESIVVDGTPPDYLLNVKPYLMGY